MIPNKFHFVHITEQDKFRSFGLHHYLCIKSCKEVNSPEEIFFYCNEEPEGEWWEKSKPMVTVVKVEPPTEIFGHPITQIAHKSDVIRLQALIEEGGVYADMDTLFLRPYTEFMDKSCVLGDQNKDGSEGICPAVIMSEPDGEFVKRWLLNFDGWFRGGPPGSDGWCTHSVILPKMMSDKFPELVHIAPYTAFFWPLYHRAGIEMLFLQNFSFPDAYSFHLWETQSREFLDELTVEKIKTEDTTYNIQARRFLDE